MIIRPTIAQDLVPLLDILRESGQFDSQGLEHVRQTLKAHLVEKSDELWFSAENEKLAGVAYCAPEVMADGVWNLLMLWTRADCRGTGIGGALVRRIEEELSRRQTRLLLVETSGVADFEEARAFYTRQGFTLEARIRDYYAPGEDKLIYVKKLYC